ncbi:sensor histidine kinase [Streptomyces sp. R302]|uniref:sensor histidine kinase n=1 Tax=unclassified Streptomyces TaxID=2593676 RepID=UPI00145F5051|nr:MULTISPECIES: histidine kinase [unclassified Streptomyces]NML53942.1 sensor histidine kinase [Streptomyces sp. R301]NML83202.1 sensor histidine kinase [Streptomyces sp. R302]
MSAMTGWWSRRSVAGKVELYTRWTFHLMAPVELLALGSVPLGRGQRGDLGLGATLGLVGWVVAHSVLCTVVASRGIDHTSGTRDRPVRLAVALAVTTALADLAVTGLWTAGALSDGSLVAAFTVVTSVFTTGALVLCVDRVRHMLGLVAGVAAVAALPLVLFGRVPEGLVTLVGVFLAGGGYAAACGFSSWLLRVVQELERSRDLKARLAVAEERLRFGRDLHDVMGRNLSVIALKSELAVQLARRGRPESVDQMVEVQRIAQESQREVREVVRGYREADLRIELEGARGVLDAAGIDCAVDAPAVDLPDGVQSALGWVVRETTTNVLRHGDARNCVITLRRTADEVLLTVENDGAAIRDGAGAPGRTGSGLAGLRERLGAVDGTLEAGLADPHSFRVTARVPLAVPEHAGTRQEKETVA